jgi:hypothetical protein
MGYAHCIPHFREDISKDQEEDPDGPWRRWSVEYQPLPLNTIEGVENTRRTRKCPLGHT